MMSTKHTAYMLLIFYKCIYVDTFVICEKNDFYFVFRFYVIT